MYAYKSEQGPGNWNQFVGISPPLEESETIPLLAYHHCTMVAYLLAFFWGSSKCMKEGHAFIFWKSKNTA